MTDYRNSKLIERYEDVVFELETALQSNYANNQIKTNYRFVVDNSCNSRQFDVNSTFYSIRSTTLSTPFEYNTVQEILTNKQLSLSVTLKTAEISVMLP